MIWQIVDIFLMIYGTFGVFTSIGNGNIWGAFAFAVAIICGYIAYKFRNKNN